MFPINDETYLAQKHHGIQIEKTIPNHPVYRYFYIIYDKTWADAVKVYDKYEVFTQCSSGEALNENSLPCVIII
jgi:hypothetical protein